MDPQDYLKKTCPQALDWALRNQFEAVNMTHLIHIIKLVEEFGKNIPLNDVVKHDKLDKGSFGAIYKAEYKGKFCAMKCIGQVTCLIPSL